jgi:hypothetical protein
MFDAGTTRILAPFIAPENGEPDNCRLGPLVRDVRAYSLKVCVFSRCREKTHMYEAAGYASGLKQFGFHPLDGAQHLPATG